METVFFVSCAMGRCFKRCCFGLFRRRCISVRPSPLAMHLCKRKRGLLSTHPTSPAAATLLLPIFTPLIMHESQIGRIHLRRSFRTGFGFTEGFQTFIAAIIHRKVDFGVWSEEWLMQVSLGLFFPAQITLFRFFNPRRCWLEFCSDGQLPCKIRKPDIDV